MDISSLSYAQLSELVETARKKMEAEERQTIENYGEVFTDNVGIETLTALPVVNLPQMAVYPNGSVKPSMLEEYPAVRGNLADGRSYVCIKVERTGKDPDNLSLLKTAILVESFFQRYINDKDNYRNDPNPSNSR